MFVREFDETKNLQPEIVKRSKKNIDRENRWETQKFTWILQMPFFSSISALIHNSFPASHRCYNKSQLQLLNRFLIQLQLSSFYSQFTYLEGFLMTLLGLLLLGLTRWHLLHSWFLTPLPIQLPTLLVSHLSLLTKVHPYQSFSDSARIFHLAFSFLILIV